MKLKSFAKQLPTILNILMTLGLFWYTNGQITSVKQALADPSNRHVFEEIGEIVKNKLNTVKLN